MHFVSSANTACIPIISLAKKFESLMYEDIMHQEIGSTISCYAGSNCNSEDVAAQEKNHADHGVKNEEKVIAFPPRFMVFEVVIFVQKPTKTMHDVFMGKPRHEFHKTKCSQKNEYPYKYIHNDIKFNLKNT